jgi:hypothetical protein
MKSVLGFFRTVFLFPFSLLMGMASNAISFQGSKLEIGTGTGGAITITAITQAFRAMVTGTHSLKVGDRVTFASVGGMTGINTLVGNVIAVTGTTTFVVDIDTRAMSAYTSGGTATPVTWTQVKNINSIKFATGSRSELDTTNLDSTSKEFLLGLKDNGSVTGDIDVAIDDAGQIALRASLGSDAIKTFRVTLPSAKVASFSGLVKKLDEGGGVDAKFTGSFEIKVTGDYSWA